MMSGMPIMRIDDILVHPRDNDLIVGTHGRGIYISTTSRRCSRCRRK